MTSNMKLKVNDTVTTYNCIEDLREDIESLWNDKIAKILKNNDNIIMIQESDDDGTISFDFHSESELSPKANNLIDTLLKDTKEKDVSNQILKVINAIILPEN